MNLPQQPVKATKQVPVVLAEQEICYIALGSNQQDPVRQVRLAINDIAHIDGVRLDQVSSLYQTKPVGFEAQPNFINAVVKVVTSLQPEALLMQLIAIESAYGRIRTAQKNEPRIIDLDILLYGELRHGELQFSSEQLTIPHPRMWERTFVLEPLFEIAPQLRIHDLRTIVVPDENILEVIECYTTRDRVLG